MSLRRLQVTNFRCLRATALQLDAKFTLISGPNASGKTSLLEAIYLLGRGRSFRTRKLDHLISRGADQFIVFGEIDAGPRLVSLGVEGRSGGLRARISTQTPSSLAEMALHLPVQIIDPEIHRLIEEGPGHRRRFLDWGVFHVEHEFVGHWQRYQQVLRQRNAALKGGGAALVAPWNADLVAFGELITQSRRRYVERLQPLAAAIAASLLGMELHLTYRAGWAKELALAEALHQSLAHDLSFGATQVGPHRAELGIRLDGLPVKDRISRGQQKLLAAALLIAQVKQFPADSLIQPTVLLDDPAAELDDDRLGNLIVQLAAQPVQLIVTTLQKGFAAFGAPGRKFAIEQGLLTAI